MPGRKDTLRGNRFPVATVPATTANSRIGSGVVRSPSPIAGWPTNSASTLNIMKTFHSSGTPIGIDDRMPKWKHSMMNAAIAVRQPARRPARTQVIREVFEERPFDEPRPEHRVVAHHRRDDEREVLVKLGCCRAEPDHQAHQFGAQDHV